MSHINFNGEVKLREPLPFRPNPFQIAQMPGFTNVPRYLFRLVGPTTAGRTTVSEVIPPISDENMAIHAQDIFQLPVEKAAGLLNAHFLWDQGHESKCNLTSWTSSLLFALQYGFFRNVRVDRRVDLDSIFLFIVDTMEFPERTFIKDMDIFKVFRSHIDEVLLQWREGKYYFGEYICQGDLCITGKCARTSIQGLIDNDLFQLYSDMENREGWAKWADRVLEFRQPFKYSQEPLRTIDAEVRTAITIAQKCYGDRWTVPMAAMLLALKPRRRCDPVIAEGFRVVFSAQEIETLSLEDLAIDSRKLPEVKQFANLINDIHHQFTGNDINLLVNPFERLMIIGSGQL